MALMNRDLFAQDPTQTKIPNDGFAKVASPKTVQEWDVLRWELRSFVCSGEYARGLERILESFLTNLSQAQQPAVWVSGFYGSGKSHLVRVLEYLWRDIELPGGERAREIVTVPDEVRDHLTELSTAGRRVGGLWSAAGMLGSGKSDAIRLALLSVLFGSAGLPEQYPLARFTMWAHDQGYLEPIQMAIETQGRSFDKEIHDLYVSPIIARALLENDPTLGDSVKDVRGLLQTQFPPMTKDITDEEMLEAIADVLRLRSPVEGKVPLTILVLDELQQYIGDDNDKALVVQNIAEAVSARFGSQVLLVATGQSALTASPTLLKLTDRFPVQVALSDKDVETVVRRVVLLKKPEHKSTLGDALDAVSGEIDRHLVGTQLATRAADKGDLVPDYPLLPTRRRFWELTLRAIDRAGKAGVLRTQLRIVHEAAARVAGEPIGHVVGGDFVYDEQATGMLQTGVLLKEIDERIRGLRMNGRGGYLQSRICALIFLISQIPARGLGGETGLRATAAMLCDLLVEDLREGGADLRKQVPELLEELVSGGVIQRVGEEYVLQTEEGAEWEREYRSRLAALRDDATWLNQLRSERLRGGVETVLGGIKVTQGTSKAPRRVSLCWSQDEPSASEGDVPIWVRDEWSATEGTVRRAAAEAGDESPIVFVFLPRREAEQIKETLASHSAAEQTLQRPTPQTDEGRAAQRAMKTRLDTEDDRLKVLFADVVSHARVFQGGGSEVTVASLRDAVETAAQRSLIRLFPRFSVGDNPNWAKVVSRVREGAPDALEAVGHHGEPTANPVCKAILAAISPGGTKGAELQKRFEAPQFGWPRDAVNGALLTLLAAGNIRASLEHKDLNGPKELSPNQIGKVTVYREDQPPSAVQRMALRGLLTAAEIPYEPGQEGGQIPALLQRLKGLAGRAGGLEPLPEPPDTEHLSALLALAGNNRFHRVADDHVRLLGDLDRWRAADQQREKREAEWGQLQRLLLHAATLPLASALEPAVAAIRTGRQLLDDPDPIPPLLHQLTTALRNEIAQRAKLLADSQHAALSELKSWDGWAQLDESQRAGLIAEAKLAPEPPPDTSTIANLLNVLDAVPLSAWQERIQLAPSRLDEARHNALARLQPESVRVSLSPVTLKSEDDLATYLVDVRARVKPHLDAGKTVIL